nr:MAG TPA: hypothetical protein [Caudoviricetes sp.]
MPILGWIFGVLAQKLQMPLQTEEWFRREPAGLPRRRKSADHKLSPRIDFKKNFKIP